MEQIRPLARKWLISIILGMLLTACATQPPPPANYSSQPPLSLHAGSLLAIVGIKPEERNNAAPYQISRSPQVGFGLNNLLAEALFDTGKFRLIEEKDLQKREFLEDLIRTYWLMPGPQYTEEELRRAATKIGAEILAYGRISHTQTVGQRVALGPFSVNTQKLVIRTNVCLYEASSRVILCHEGQGEAEQEGKGVGYEFRFDNLVDLTDNRLDFEKSGAGRAIKQAITLAVQHLMTNIQFLPSSASVTQP